MTLVRRILDLCVLLALLAPLAACGCSPITFADLPLHPAATPLQAGSHPLADKVAGSFRQAISQGNVQLDMQLYALPADTSWRDIKRFYEEQIAGDWKVAQSLAQDTQAFKTIGWTRGGLASEQGLAIGYGPALLGNPPFLMVALFSE